MHKQLNKDMCADNTIVCFTGWDGGGGGDGCVCMGGGGGGGGGGGRG